MRVVSGGFGGYSLAMSNAINSNFRKKPSSSGSSFGGSSHSYSHSRPRVKSSSNWHNDDWFELVWDDNDFDDDWYDDWSDDDWDF